jgi:hypothetical protein
MRPEYYEIYRELTELYRVIQGDAEWMRGFRRRRYPSVHSLRIVDEALEAAIGEMQLTRRLRPDARHLLLINLHQMITLPLEYPFGYPDEAPLDRELARDIHIILEEARAESRDEEISGHDIINSLSRVWDKLSTTSRNVWG